MRFEYHRVMLETKRNQRIELASKIGYATRILAEKIDKEKSIKDLDVFEDMITILTNTLLHKAC